jgi:uncharacterized membrane protein YdbT with pleckstrin-like domain
MGYIKRNLMDNERLVFQTKLHRVIFIWPVLWFIVALVLFGIGINISDPKLKTFTVVTGGLFTVFAIFTFIPPLIRYIASEFGVTNRRVIMKIGFIRRRSLEVLLNRIEGIQVDQSIWGRILGFGSITVTGIGGAHDPFHNISAPFEFRRKTEEQIASFQDSRKR